MSLTGADSNFFLESRYEKFAQEKNIQMLAMVAILLLKAYKPVVPPRQSSAHYLLVTRLNLLHIRRKFSRPPRGSSCFTCPANAE
jgi:hypothetical protein